jgi:hypothetical protein
VTFGFRKGAFRYVSILALVFAFFAVVGIKQSGFDANNAFFIAAFFFLLVLAFVARVISLDIMVDSDGIHRRFFERTVLFIRWSDIKIIKDVVKKGFGGESSRFFYVIPDAGAPLRFWSRGAMRFSDRMYDFSVFVDVMNKQVRSHGVRVERISGIDIEVCDEIFVSGFHRKK